MSAATAAYTFSAYIWRDSRVVTQLHRWQEANWEGKCEVTFICCFFSMSWTHKSVSQTFCTAINCKIIYTNQGEVLADLCSFSKIAQDLWPAWCVSITFQKLISSAERVWKNQITVKLNAYYVRRLHVFRLLMSYINFTTSHIPIDAAIWCRQKIATCRFCVNVAIVTNMPFRKLHRGVFLKLTAMSSSCLNPYSKVQTMSS